MPRNALLHNCLRFTSDGLLKRGQIWRYANELNKELGLIWIASLCRNSLSLAKGPKRPREVGVVWGGRGVGWGWSVGVIPKRGQNKYMWRLEDGSYLGGGGVAVALM